MLETMCTQSRPSLCSGSSPSWNVCTLHAWCKGANSEARTVQPWVLVWSAWGQAHTTIVAATTKCDGPRCATRCQLFWGRPCTALACTASNHNMQCPYTTCYSLATCINAPLPWKIPLYYNATHIQVAGHSPKPANPRSLTHSCMVNMSIITFSKRYSPSS